MHLRSRKPCFLPLLTLAAAAVLLFPAGCTAFRSRYDRACVFLSGHGRSRRDRRRLGGDGRRGEYDSTDRGFQSEQRAAAGPPDPNYVNAMTNLENAGGSVVTYIYTGNGGTARNPR